jgi:hypothetical protein
MMYTILKYDMIFIVDMQWWCVIFELFIVFFLLCFWLKTRIYFRSAILGVVQCTCFITKFSLYSLQQ